MSNEQVGMVKRRSKKGRKEVPPFTDHLEKHITGMADLIFFSWPKFKDLDDFS